MIRFIIAVLVLALAYWALFDWRRTPPEKKRQKSIQFALYAVALSILVLVLMGRANILLAPIAFLIPYIKRLAFDSRVQGWLFERFIHRQRNGAEDSSNIVATDMEVKEAREIFGFTQDEQLDKDKIKERHRALIQKIHPDKKDGSEYLASKINLARDVLLKKSNVS